MAAEAFLRLRQSNRQAISMHPRLFQVQDAAAVLLTTYTYNREQAASQGWDDPAEEELRAACNTLADWGLPHQDIQGITVPLAFIITNKCWDEVLTVAHSWEFAHEHAEVLN